MFLIYSIRDIFINLVTDCAGIHESFTICSGSKQGNFFPCSVNKDIGGELGETYRDMNYIYTVRNVFKVHEIINRHLSCLERL